ncbi:hypothetical protein [Paenibacillus odorifer]|uniref:hypothetical protein n=1 Tax=Paenibacillus odorifer TaxID=189426 RepID=UPI00096E2C88|nr:hypothetical protein [Paenibacillus odorifer]OME23405.1 hypothetical protein BSK57_16465 [Paenibacillus odorifer]
MSVHVVSYDLNKGGKDYEGLYKVLKSFAYWHYLDSTWLIYSSLTATQLFEKLKPHIDANDTCLVIKVTPEYSGWLTQDAWDWIKQHLG